MIYLLGMFASGHEKEKIDKDHRKKKKLIKITGKGKSATLQTVLIAFLFVGILIHGKEEWVLAWFSV